MICKSNIETPDPCGHGWKVDKDGQLSIQWITGLPAPEKVLNLLSCRCRKSCNGTACTCRSNGLKCTKMCLLQECDNQPDDSERYISEEDDDDELYDIL